MPGSTVPSYLWLQDDIKTRYISAILKGSSAVSLLIQKLANEIATLKWVAAYA